MAQDVDWRVCFEIVSRVVNAHKAGTPITWPKGPCSDRLLKKRLGIPRHQSVLCASVKHLVLIGTLRLEETDDLGSAIMGEREYYYPVVRIVPGWT